MAVGSFSQKISLEGAQEITRLLAEIAQAGQRAFGQVEAATTGASAGVARFTAIVTAARAQFASLGAAASNVGSAVSRLGNSFNNLGSALTGTASKFALIAGVGGISAATFGLAKFIQSSAQAGEQILETSQGLGLTVEKFQQLGFAARQSGLDQEQFARALSNLNKIVQDGVQEQNKALLDFAKGLQTSFGGGFRIIDDFRAKIGPTFQELSALARDVAAQLKGRGIDVPLSIITEQLRRMATGTAESRKQFEILAQGGVQLARGALEAFGQDVDKTGNVLRRLGIRLTEIGPTGKLVARDLGDIFTDLAEVMSRTGNESERLGIAQEIFGNRLARKLIPVLIEGKAGIQELADEFRRAATGFSGPQAKAADALGDAFVSLGESLRDVRNQLAAPLFAPLTAAAQAMQRVIGENRKAFEDFGFAIHQRVTPVIIDFIRLISGRENEIQNTWIITLRNGIVEFATTARNALFNVIIPAFVGLKAMLDSVAATFNNLFKTKLTGGELGIALLVGHFTGLLGAITNVVIAVGVLALALTRLALSPIFIKLTLLAGGIAVLVDFVKKMSGEISPLQAHLQGTASGMDALVQKSVELAQGLNNGTISAQQAGAELQRLSGNATAAGTAAQQSGLRVRELGTSAGFAIREVTTAGGTVIREVSAIGQAAQQAGAAVQQGMGQAEQGLSEVGQEADRAGNEAASAIAPLQTIGEGIAFGSTLSGLALITDALRTLVTQAIRGRDALQSVGGFDGGSVPGGGYFASGGYTGSIGSRRIAGFVHGNEYVEPAHVVRQPGVLAFLELLRRMGGDLESTIARFSRGYSMGGFVERLNSSLSQLVIPSFATGGFAEAIPARAGRDLGTVRLDFGGGQRFTVMSDESTVDSLQRFAVRRHTLSAGKKF